MEHMTSSSESDKYRNPEPPDGLLQETNDADNVGDTVFSKHWVFTTLMNLLQVKYLT